MLGSLWGHFGVTFGVILGSLHCNPSPHDFHLHADYLHAISISTRSPSPRRPSPRDLHLQAISISTTQAHLSQTTTHKHTHTQTHTNTQNTTYHFCFLSKSAHYNLQNVCRRCTAATTSPCPSSTCRSSMPWLYHCLCILRIAYLHTAIWSQRDAEQTHTDTTTHTPPHHTPHTTHCHRKTQK